MAKITPKTISVIFTSFMSPVNFRCFTFGVVRNNFLQTIFKIIAQKFEIRCKLGTEFLGPLVLHELLVDSLFVYKGYYTGRPNDINFLFRVVKQYFTNKRSE